MLSKIRRHLTYANVMATLAVFIAIGGGAYAAAQLPKDSVGTRELKDNEVRSRDVRNLNLTGRDIRNETLKGNKVKDGRLKGVDIGDDSLTGIDIDESSLAGVDADQLDGLDSAAFIQQGSAAGGDLSGSYPNPSLSAHAVHAVNLDALTATETQVTVPAAGAVEGNGSYSTRGATASCVGTTTAIGGAAYWDIQTASKELTISQTRYTDFVNLNGEPRPKSYFARGGNDTSQDRQLTVQAICLGD